MSCLHPVSIILFQGWNWSNRTTPPSPKEWEQVCCHTCWLLQSKWPEAVPFPDISAFGVGMFLYELFCRYAYTVVYICRHAHISISTSTDLDAVRLSFQIRVVNLWTNFRMSCIDSGTEHHVTSAYHPQTNGLTERFNQTLQTALLKLVNDTQTDWDEHLPAVLFAYRTSQQKATRLTPLEVMFCRYVTNLNRKA